MHRYFIKMPWLFRKLYSRYVFQLPGEQREVYLSFDDGPHPQITAWVLDLLKEYDAKASFFCIGKNVEQYPETYARILAEGHSVGNHTHRHLRGWKTNDEEYVADTREAAAFIRSKLFRPPYGRIRSSQARRLMNDGDGYKVILWDVLSGDFDKNFSGEQCFQNVAKHVKGGSIVVFHDSEKAFPNLQFALPKTLEFLKKEGYLMKKIDV